MNFNALLNKKLTSKLLSYVSYYCDKPYAVTEQNHVEQTSVKPIVIVSRKHYIEEKLSFPAVSLSELKKLLQLQFSSEKLLKTQIIENSSIEGFDVHVTRYQIEDAPLLAKAFVLIPETHLIGNKNHQQVITLQTPAGDLFVSNFDQLNSVYKAGLINSPQSYKFSVGLPLESEELNISRDELLNAYTTALLELDFSSLFKFAKLNMAISTKPEKLHILYLAPLASVTVYLALTVAWQYASLELTNSEVSKLQGEANQVLTQKQKLDSLNQLVTTFNTHIASKPLVNQHWQIVYLALENNAKLEFLRMENGVLSLSGNAPNANLLLAEINKIPFIEKAMFQGSTRKNNGRDNFTFEIHLVKES